MIEKDNIRTAAVVGGGFIGLEMAENLRHAGLDVSLIEASDQVMALLDFEMAQMLHENILQNSVRLFLGDGVASLRRQRRPRDHDTEKRQNCRCGSRHPPIGVRPNSELAKSRRPGTEQARWDHHRQNAEDLGSFHICCRRCRRSRRLHPQRTRHDTSGMCPPTNRAVSLPTTSQAAKNTMNKTQEAASPKCSIYSSRYRKQ